MKKHFSRIFAVLLVVSMLFTQLLVPVSAEVDNCTCDPATRTGKKDGVSVSADCTAWGYQMYKCNACKGSYAIFTEAPKGHDYVDHAGQAPTCTAIGWADYQTCNNCDYTSYAELPMIDHNLEDVLAQDPTCETIGWKEYKDCTECDYVEGYEVIPVLPHVAGDEVIENVVEAGCETPATQDVVVYCAECGVELSRKTVETAPAHGHNYLLTDSKPAICMKADGMNVYTCEYCRDVKREVIVMPEEHDYKLKEAIIDCENGDKEIHECKVCGFTVEKSIPALGHDWEDATCDAPKTCKRCGKTEGAPLAHTYKKVNNKEVVTVIEPTCVDTGYSTRYCTRCKKDILVEGSETPIDPMNHAAQFISVAKVEPTCTTDGSTAEISCVCGENGQTIILDPIRVIPALGHNWGAPTTVKMTCERDGYTVKVCKTCKVTEKYDIIPACGHDLDPTVGHKAPTCEVQGYDYQACLCEFDGVRCTYEDKSNFVPALGHDWSEWIMVDENTHTRICQYAECEVEGGKVEIADHNIVNHEAKAPTCTEIGWDAYVTCSDCEYTTYVEKAPLGHRNERWAAQEATCTQDGWSAHIKCAVCGESTPHSFTPAYGHQIMNVPAQAPSCFEPGWAAHTECARCGEVSDHFILAPYGEHAPVVDEAVQPTFDETGLTEGSHCERCNVVFVEQIVIDRIKEEVSFTYEATGLNGSEYTVNSGYVTLNVYMNVNSTAARLWGADLTLKFDPNLTLTSVDGCAFEYSNNSDVLNNSIKLAQGMNVGSNFKNYEMGQYLFATLTFKVNKDFHSADAMFEIVADECNLVRRDIENNTDFLNELVVDFGTGTEIYVAQLGDANADGKFNSIDTMSLAQWFANADIDSYEAVYDMNKDGNIDGDDFAILRGAVVRDYSYLED